jgi:light-regulated signal transduction histidine kinase (bacteriophytochrome)
VLEQINFLMVSLFLLAILSGLSASYVVFSSILKRVNDLEHYARRVSRNQTAHWEDSGEDELGQLGRNLRIMTDNLLAREEALRHTRRQLEQANNNLKQQLLETRAANQELEAFSYSVSHDLRAPLRHVAGFSELMLKNADSLDAKNLRYLNIISSSIRQMGVLIDELLAFSRMGRTAIKADNIDLNATVNEVFTDFSPDIAARHIKWEIADLPVVQGDRVMLKLVLQNLIGNAVKYTRDRDPAIIQIRDESAPDDTMAQIVITDNGVGFNMDYADKLFGVFQRLHSSEEYEGTGIGLATVRRIVHRHGGKVSAYGDPGEGARFTFTLPKGLESKVQETTA